MQLVFFNIDYLIITCGMSNLKCIMINKTFLIFLIALLLQCPVKGSNFVLAVHQDLYSDFIKPSYTSFVKTPTRGENNLDVIIVNEFFPVVPAKLTELNLPSNSIVQLVDLDYQQIKSAIQKLIYLRKYITAIANGSWRDPLVAILGKIRVELGLPGMRYPILELFNDKHLMKQKVLSSGIRSAQEMLFTPKNLDIFVDRYGLPILIKPRRKACSKDIVEITSAKMLLIFKKRLLSYPLNDYIIEQFIQGKAFYALNGYMINRKLIYSVLKRSYPSCLLHYKYKVARVEIVITDSYIVARANKMLRKVCNALGVRTLPFNFEFLVKDNKLYFIEIAARFGGGMWNLGKDLGFDLSRIGICLDLGLIPKVPPVFCGACFTVVYLNYGKKIKKYSVPHNLKPSSVLINYNARYIYLLFLFYNYTECPLLLRAYAPKIKLFLSLE